MAGLNDLYQQYFGRDGDAEGMAYWQGQLNSGASLSDIGNQFNSIAKDYSVNSSNYDSSITSQGYTPQQVAANLGGLGMAGGGGGSGFQFSDAAKKTLAETLPYASSSGEPPEQYGYDSNALLKELNDQYSTYTSNLDSERANNALKTNQVFGLSGGYFGTVGQDGSMSIGKNGFQVGDNYQVWSPDGKGGYTAENKIKEARTGWMNSIGDLVAKVTPAIVATMSAGAFGVGPFSPTGAFAPGAATSGALDVSGAGLDQYLGDAAAGGLETGALDVSGLGLDQYLGEGVLEGGLDVSNLGLDQYLDGWPDLETLGTTLDGGLVYPGMPGYIPPPGGIDPSNYGNEGKNYVGPGAVSTTQSPINATTGPGAAPTVPLSPIGDPATNPTGPTTTTKTPVIPTTKTTTTTPGGGDLGTLLGLLYGAYSKNRNSKALEDILTEMKGMYKPGSPEAELMRQKIEARDAKAGRRSQYGRREVELAGTLADARMRTLSSPGFMTMQAAMMNNSTGGGGLSELLAALSGGNTGLNLPFNLNDLLNTGLIDGEGYLSDLFK